MNQETKMNVIPLTQEQLGVYLDEMQSPASLKYHIPVQFTLPAGVRKDRLFTAVRASVLRHPILCAGIGLYHGAPSMFEQNAGEEIPIEEYTAANVETIRSGFCRPFDMESGPLCRFAFVETPKESVLLFDVHHLVFDGSSLDIFAREIAANYEKGDPGEKAPSFFDFAKKREAQHDPARIEALRTLFREKLEDLDCDARPVPDQILPDVPAAKASVACTSDETLFCAVNAFVRENKLTENALLLAAFGFTLSKFNGTSQSVFSTVHHGRYTADEAGTIGMFVRTLPAICSFSGELTPAALAKTMSDDYYQMKQNDCVPFSELAQDYGISTAVSFAYHGSLFRSVPLADGEMQIVVLNPGDPIADLEFAVNRSEGSYTATANYNTAVYTPAFAKSFAQAFLCALRGMVSAKALGEINLVGAESQTLLDRFNQTEKAYDTAHTVVDLFRKQAKETPDAPCLVYCARKYSYAQVDAITDNLASHLAARNIGKGDIVGVLIPRCEHMLLASLGVLKSGAAYLPLDPSYPAGRLKLMMHDSGAAFLIADKSVLGILEADYSGPLLMTDEIESLPEGKGALPPQPDDLFVMLYTSGSTGTPKGVMLTHGNAMVTAAWERDFYALGRGCNVTAYASYGFDANVFDTYATITSGATLHIIADEIRLDLIALQRYFNENKITHCVFTTQVGRQFAQLEGTTTLRCLSVGGEKLTALAPPKDFSFYNLYGPTEGTVLVTGFLVDRLYKDVPIGKAIDNVKLYVVDANGKLLPPGAAGELWIAGPHVTKGYWNNPEKTAEAYVENPFDNNEDYLRAYRTGDIVRLLGDGNVQFIGRRDGQIKVRGFRIELTEVEEVVRRFPGIKDATVAAFDDLAGGKYIAAYIVADEEISIEQLNAFIREEKPAYLVPAVTMQIDHIPLTQNHKVDRKRLPVPERKSDSGAQPENERQQQIFDLAAEVIGHRGFGIDTDLFDAGLTSVGVLRFNVLLSKAFDVAVKLGDLRENATVRKLETLFSFAQKTAVYDLRDAYPITRTQQGIFVECSRNKDTTVYNIPLLLKLDQSLDSKRLQTAVCQAIDAHPYLKATLFADAEGNIRAKRNDSEAAIVKLEQVSSLPDTAALVRPYDLLSEPLYRAEVIETNEELYLFFDAHHIVFDGTSAAILLADIESAYHGLPPAREVFTGFETALEEVNARTSERLADAKAYYEKLLRGCETECLPLKAPQKDGVRAAVLTRREPCVAKVKSWCEQNKLTPNALFVTAFGFTLSRFTSLDDVVFTTVYNGRNDSRLQRQVAMLVKTLPVLLHTREKDTRAMVSGMQTQLMDSMSNDVFSFAEIANAYGVRSDVMFVYQGDSFRFDTLCGKPAVLIPLPADTPKAPITIMVEQKENDYLCRAEYRGDLYSAAFMEHFLDALMQAVKEFCDKKTTAEISLLSEHALRAMEERNATAEPFENIPAHSLFEREAMRRHDKLAVADRTRTLSFAQLNALANQVAHSLHKRGLQNESIVGIMLPRTVDVFAAELGVMKAGGAFLGLLPNYPDDRVDFCLKDAGSAFVITTEEILQTKGALFTLDKPYQVLTMEQIRTETQTENPDLQIQPNQPAYCIYTSGTTGKPKGVIIEHHSFASFIEQKNSAADWYFGNRGGSVSLSMSAITFDMSIFEGLVFLMRGKAVVIASEKEIHDPAALGQLIEDYSVEVVTGTPSFYTNYIDIPAFSRAVANLKTIMVGAEAFPAALYQKLRKTAPQAVIMNGYGPSECTICSSIKRLENGGNITIGGPLSNTAYFVMDKGGNLLPPYACGELIICGEQVGRGYIGLPEKTAASFFRLNGMPAYHSGDLVRALENGEIQCVGRMDDQIKLRGFRIELGEIERCICAFRGVKQSKVVVRSNGKEDFLAGFFTAEREVELSALNAHMKASLAYYMVPDAMMQLDVMPLTPNGKIDKKALPEIGRERKKSRTGRRPKRSLEAELCDLFGAVLSVDDYCADDNFFEMGGTSLSASKVIMQLMAKDIKVDYQDIFDCPTPEALALHIESQRAPVAVSEATIAQKQPFSEQLAANTLAHAKDVKRTPLGDVLLTGAVGFLGVHVLRELIDKNEGNILCLVRSDEVFTAEKRLKHILMYYFGSIFEDAFSRITVIDADITNDDLFKILAHVHFDTLINCAAVVKHYAADEQIEHVNVHGVENLIRCAREKNARMIQISTTSIPGVHTEESYRQRVRMYENELFLIDSMNNKYLLSKYHAELKMLEAIRDGLQGKIMRVGNLMGRYSDGEFQINSDTNAFLHALRGFVTIGKCPISHATDPMRLSPIDLTARAIVLLAGTNAQFTAFNVDNRFGFDEMQLIHACNECGVAVTPVDDEEYYADYHRMLADERVNSRLSGLVTNDKPGQHMVETDNTFTANILYRIGFSWPLVDSDYLVRLIESLKTLDYFSPEE